MLGPCSRRPLAELISSPLQRVNTVDVIYGTWPLFLYTNATIGKQLLLPLLEYQASGQYLNQWCVHNMGLFCLSLIFTKVV